MTSELHDSEWIDEMLAEFDHFLTVKEVAVLLNVEERTIRTLLSTAVIERRMPGIKVGDQWRIPRARLREYLMIHQNDSSAVTRASGEGTLHD